MGQEFPGIFGGFGLGQTLKRWQRALRAPEVLSSADLKRINGDIRSMRDRLDTMAAQSRSALLARSAGSDGIDRPDQCDWATRPAPWREEMRPRGMVGLSSPQPLPGGATVFHDANHTEMSLRQETAPHWVQGAQFGLVLEVYRSDGSFVSFVQDLAPEALAGLTRNHFITVNLVADREQPVEIYARLNIQHGPNVEQMVRQVDFEGTKGQAEFDLAYTKINEKRLEKAWLDLILEGPKMTRIALWDMVVLRAPRADF
ncbi:DUF6478 family protein [Rhodobacteraceae bacterium N5(2021)]|uniref:DUF6478 family protein n=1 Tax=Gymnodinialimonas phycosphaerae TaxID=2841589 RepID=A0A975TT25_9RHOB|nr:DUF6478 family protein [Gymnodinialimonas phycosphaerae]MBY4894150.1 DUF6478 family protein [Gymnodinialimonas phycosphaerae]